MTHKTVDEVADAKVAELLTLIWDVVILDTERSCDASVLDSGTDEDSDTLDRYLADKVSRRHDRGLLAV